MATLKQLAANRRNSQKSTGPRTAEGKAKVRFNALKFGIDAESLIIPSEDPEDYRAFAADLTASFNPVSPAEQVLVDRLVKDEWRLRRLYPVEAQLWAGSLKRVKELSTFREEIAEEITFSWCASSLERLQRLIASIQRSYNQTLAALHRLRKEMREQTQLAAVLRPAIAETVSLSEPNPLQPLAPTPVLPPPVPPVPLVALIPVPLTPVTDPSPC